MNDVFDISPDGVVNRKATADEILAREELQEVCDAKVLDEAAKAETKAAVLEKLGLTADEVAALLA